jgi:predicted  nucleic acid-binding Zn-ribbon protein
MQGDLPFLITLQQHDAAIDELREKAEAFVPLIQKKNQQVETLKTSLKSAKDALSSHQVRKKQLELDADAQEKTVQKHQGALNSLKSNDAYKAMLEEIKAAKDAVVKIEDEILSLMEAVDADDKRYKELEKKFKTDEASMKSEVQAIESEKNAALELVKKKQAERDAFAATVPPALLSKYDVIREKGNGIAIVPMVRNSCGGCHMGLTTAKANEVKKAKEMVLCDSCSRILYIPAEETVSAAPVAPPS